MRPKNTSKEKWVIDHELWFPSENEARSYMRNRSSVAHAKLPYDLEFIGDAKTMWGQYRRDQWRLREYRPILFKGKSVQTVGMSPEMLADKGQYYPGQKPTKIKGAYYFLR